MLLCVLYILNSCKKFNSVRAEQQAIGIKLSQNSRLYIVATPIGNLADITLRAIEVLKSVNLIAAEDTRHSKCLLNHYAIDTPVLSLHEYNEKQRISLLLSRL